MPQHGEVVICKTVMMGDRRPMVVKTTKANDGILLELHAKIDDVHHRLEVRTGATPIAADDAACNWDMARGIPRFGARVFEVPLSVAYRIMFSNPDKLDITEEEKRLATDTMSRLYFILRDLAIHAADTCHQPSRALAMRFAPHLRFRVYDKVIRDQTGRIAQAAVASPGLIIFALSLMEDCWGYDTEHRDIRVVGQRIFDCIVAGRSLKKILHPALMLWSFAAKEEAAAFREAKGHGNMLWEHVATASSEEMPRILLRKRLMIMRAGHRVPTNHLRIPPPLSFVPEDIPRATMANARWYRVMKVARVTLIPAVGREREQRALGAFMSKNADFVFRSIGRDDLHTDLEGVLDYVAAIGRLPGRNTDPESLLRASRDWHRQIAMTNDIETLAALVPAERVDRTANDIHFPSLPVASPEDGDLKVLPIRTATALMQEGREMRHCVASYVKSACIGESFFYSVRCAGRRLTMQLHRQGESRLSLGQVSGRANRTPTPEEMNRIGGWIVQAETELGALMQL